MLSPRARPWILWLLFAIGSGFAYRWVMRAPGHPLHWDRDLGGYYNHLARGLLAGHLYLPITPHPRLLTLADPWNPAVEPDIKVHDLAFFRGRYYQYHGVGPALLLFSPWRLVTGHDLPERAAVWFFAWAGSLLWSAALLRWLTRAQLVSPALALLAVATCTSVPFLLNRVYVYEVAIAGGYFCLAAAFLALSFPGRAGLLWAGLSFGFAIACRPHLGLAAVAALVFLFPARDLRRRLTLLAPLALCGLLLLLYNYARFDSPFEFGIRYLFTVPHGNRVRLTLENILPGLRVFAAQPPHFTPVFPWIRLAFHPEQPWPPEFFLEPAIGAIFLAPFLLVLFLPLAPPLRALRNTLLFSSAAILLFLASTGWATQRYEADFLPLAVFAAALVMATRRQTLFRPLAGLAVFSGLIVNAAIALTGPYDEMARHRPLNYLRLANTFTLEARHRLALDPAFEVNLELAEPAAGPFSEPVASLGHPSHRIQIFRGRDQGQLYVEILQFGAPLVRQPFNNASRRWSIGRDSGPGQPLRILAADGTLIVAAPVPSLLLAPSEIEPGPWVKAIR